MILMRHAQSHWNHHFGATRIDPALHDPLLTSKGETQASQALDRLRSYGIKRLVSSPYRRTIHTAKVVATALDLPIIVDARAAERRFFSCDIGTLASDLRRRWDGLDLSGLDECWWGRHIESMDSFERRCSEFSSAMRNQPEFDSTLVVTHWGVIRALTGRTVDNTEIVELANERRSR